MISRIQSGEITAELSKKRSKIVVIYGARQVGKSTLVQHLLQGIEGRVLAIDGDQRQHAEILSGRNLADLQALVAGYDILFVDEAQHIPDIGINLKIMHDHIHNLKIIVTGSSSLELRERVAEPLTGRHRMFHLHPIALPEWQEYTSGNSFELRQEISNFLLYGQYPEVMLLPNRQDKIDHLMGLRDAYLYKDILVNARIEYPEKIPMLLKLLACQIGNEVSIQEIAGSLQIHRDTVLHYIDLLEKSFVIYRLSGFSRNLRKEVTKLNKIYFVDTGIRNAVIGDFSSLETRADKGALWENFLISEFFKKQALSRGHANFYFWRLHSGAEIDLVVEQEGMLTGYETKWKSTGRRNAPASWTEAYPTAQYDIVHPGNFTVFFADVKAAE